MKGGSSTDRLRHSPMFRYIRHNHLWEITYRPLTNETSPEYQTAMQKLTQVCTASPAAQLAMEKLALHLLCYPTGEVRAVSSWALSWCTALVHTAWILI